jgi:hypothetical protein
MTRPGELMCEVEIDSLGAAATEIREENSYSFHNFDPLIN